MSGTKQRFFSGPSLEAALMRAARVYRAEPERLAYKKLEKRHGFLKIRRSVVIEVDPESPLKKDAHEAGEAPVERSTRLPDAKAAPRGRPPQTPEVDRAPAETPRPVPEAAREPASDEEAEDAAAESPSEGAMPDLDTVEAARDGMERILEVTGLELESRVEPAEELVGVELRGADQELLVAQRGKLLLSIQHLLPRVIRGLAGRTAPCRVDSANFHDNRQRRLEELAERSASEVQRRGEPWTLEPMAPDERRIVHLALADNPDVVTESEGRGYFKRVQIRPVQNRPRGFDRYNR